MKAITPYLNFDGTCAAAMKFYQECLGGTLDMQTFGDAPMPDMPASMNDRVMHARLANGPVEIMASDTMPGHDFTAGTGVHLSVHCESDEEADRLFHALGKGGTVTMELQDTFWNARFGMLRDKFGMNWMFNHQRS